MAPKTPTGFGSRMLVSLVNLALMLLVLLTIIAIFVPFAPTMPAGSLDPSWQWASNAAVVQGLVFGRDFIFTFGPYSSIYTKAYHPATDFRMMAGSLYLAFAYWLAFAILAKGVRWRWVLAFCAMFAGVMYARDVLLFSLPLLVALQTFKVVDGDDNRLLDSRWFAIAVALTFSTFGLLPLIKGSTIVLCLGTVVLCSAYYFVSRRRLLAMLCLAAPAVSLVVFWRASGQPVSGLPGYFTSMAPITSGYTEAMALTGSASEVVFYLVACLALLLATALQSRIAQVSRLFLFGSVFLYLFIAFKAGFVRHDGHALIAGTALLLAALLFPFVIRSWAIVPIIILTALCWTSIDQHYRKSSVSSVRANIQGTYSGAWNAFRTRLSDKRWPRRDYDTAVARLRTQAAFPLLKGRTDIYSYDQSFLLASGNTWSPRPVFQSYSAYTKVLATINRDHLLGDGAPDNIIFRVQPIDRRFPSIEDGLSWPVLMLRYQPVRLENNFLFLEKRANAAPMAQPVLLATRSARFGEPVELPTSNGPIFAEVDIDKTLLGRLADALYKPSELGIAVELRHGARRVYRMIAGMAHSGFLLSPLIENTAEFGTLYREPKFLDAKLVKSLTIAPLRGPTWLWRERYTIRFSRIARGAATDTSAIYKFDHFEDDFSGLTIVAADRCDGAIDMVNGIRASPRSNAPKSIAASTLLEIRGWLAVSAATGVVPDATYVVLTDAQGKHSFLRTRVSPRPDVGAHFKLPSLVQAGYITSADVSSLEGQYTLGLAMKRANHLAICPRFRVPISIAR
ncbi:MAG: hypothetical protein WAV22_11745 [Porticoccaceae bacterium]